MIPTDSKVTTIGAYAFYRNDYITKLVTEPTTEAGALYIPANITFIENEAFCLCENLNSIAFSDSIDGIGNYAFQFCGSLRDVDLGNGIEKIGRGSFSYCDALTSVVIPDSVKEIGMYAFDECEALTDIYFEADVLPETLGTGWNGKTDPEIHLGFENPEEPVDPEPPVADDSYDTTGNVALNKTYDAKGYSVAGVSDYTANLTDGKASNTLTYDNNWFAFCTSQGDNGINAPDGVGVVFIDLEKIYDIDSFKVNAVVGENVENSGISGPAKVSAYITDTEGGVYDYVGDLTTEVKDGIAWLTLDKKVTGRYVARNVSTAIAPHKQKKGPTSMRLDPESGGYLLSRNSVPSAIASLTSLFGMGRGGTSLP